MTSMRLARPRLPATLVLLSLATLPLAAPTAIAQAPLVPVLACREEPSDTLRLRCYDLEVDRLRAAQARQATATTPAAAVAPAPATAPTPAKAPAPMPASSTPAAAAVPGLAPAATPIPAPKPRAARPPASQNVKVTAITLRKDRTFVATFDNGETWEQFPGDQPVPMQVGLDVQLLRLAFGSTQVVGPRHHWSVTVRRVDDH